MQERGEDFGEGFMPRFLGGKLLGWNLLVPVVAIPSVAVSEWFFRCVVPLYGLEACRVIIVKINDDVH